MYSYRHIFHAGNHADVFKHIILIELLEYMCKKDNGFTYIDTHAASGWYPIFNKNDSINKESKSGIELLMQAKFNPPESIKKYLALVENCKLFGLNGYPGSPFIALHYLREQDQIQLCEGHPAEIQILRNNLIQKKKEQRQHSFHYKRPVILQTDSFFFLKSVLPPQKKRGIIFIDPSYENKLDYNNLQISLLDGIKRFSSGIFAVWYPLIDRSDALTLPVQLAKIFEPNWIHATINIKNPTEKRTKFKQTPLQIQKSSFYGSGIIIKNPPYTLEKKLREILPYLVRILGQDNQAGFSIESNQH